MFVIGFADNMHTLETTSCIEDPEPASISTTDLAVEISFREILFLTSFEKLGALSLNSMYLFYVFFRDHGPFNSWDREIFYFKVTTSSG